MQKIIKMLNRVLKLKVSLRKDALQDIRESLDEIIRYYEDLNDK